ncbi:MAG TPA: NlpC/P60 family protein, partial [Pseudonocardiaceae bacterium]|nr:NlpC/P60 family protein [Pseudonocardiaceae bacterium]
DMFGDFNKIGFDCSGLMVYAFAGAGVFLPHFSGYQYQSGEHVPLSRIRPGDMLFYSSNGRASGIHHVTLYIGHGQMVEAFESGRPVRVTSVRYYGGIMPYATRVL